MPKAEVFSREAVLSRCTPEPNTGCWFWDGATNRGYGSMTSCGLKQRAHRVAYEVFVGPVPAGLHVLHKCDIPSCVNPEHLFVGTHLDNIRDKCAKGRQAKGANMSARLPHGSEVHGAKLTDAAVRDIRTRVASGEPAICLARAYGVTAGTVSLLVNRITWKHVE